MSWLRVVYGLHMGCIWVEHGLRSGCIEWRMCGCMCCVWVVYKSHIYIYRLHMGCRLHSGLVLQQFTLAMASCLRTQASPGCARRMALPLWAHLHQPSHQWVRSHAMSCNCTTMLTIEGWSTVMQCHTIARTRRHRMPQRRSAQSSQHSSHSYHKWPSLTCCL